MAVPRKTSTAFKSSLSGLEESSPTAHFSIENQRRADDGDMGVEFSDGVNALGLIPALSTPYSQADCSFSVLVRAILTASRTSRGRADLWLTFNRG